MQYKFVICSNLINKKYNFLNSLFPEKSIEFKKMIYSHQVRHYRI